MTSCSTGGNPANGGVQPAPAPPEDAPREVSDAELALLARYTARTDLAALREHVLAQWRRAVSGTAPVYCCVRTLMFLEPRISGHSSYPRALRAMQQQRQAGTAPLWLVGALAASAPAVCRPSILTTQPSVARAGRRLRLARVPLLCSLVCILPSADPANRLWQHALPTACACRRTLGPRWAPTSGSCGWTAWRNTRWSPWTSPSRSTTGEGLKSTCCKGSCPGQLAPHGLPQLLRPSPAGCLGAHVAPTACGLVSKGSLGKPGSTCCQLRGARVHLSWLRGQLPCPACTVAR